MTKAAAIKAEIDRTLAAVEEANATLQVGDYEEITFRMTKVAAMKSTNRPVINCPCHCPLQYCTLYSVCTLSVSIEILAITKYSILLIQYILVLTQALSQSSLFVLFIVRISTVHPRL
jgi:hypothetical protein